MRRAGAPRRLSTPVLILLIALFLIAAFVLNLSFLSHSAATLDKKKDPEPLPFPAEPFESERVSHPEPPRYKPLKHNRPHAPHVQKYADPACPFAGPWKMMSTATFDWHVDQPRWILTPISPIRPRRIYQPLDLNEEPVVTVAIPFHNTPFNFFNETVVSVRETHLCRALIVLTLRPGPTTISATFRADNHQRWL